jgi:decaprenylphospho-beta-D-erythro-pentofuranosid-2-ulose 2-reductase
MTPPDGTRQRVLIVGATSAIAAEVARTFAERGATLVITGRNAERLAVIGSELRALGAQVDAIGLDVVDLAAHAGVVDRAFAAGNLDVALIAHGVLPDQARCQENVAETVRALEVNFTATVALLTLLANRFEAQRRGTIAVISSVAGDRGRMSNYVYGASKGGLTVFLQGLRNRLAHAGVSVVTLKPGFVDTPMTAAVRKSALFASPERAGRAIHRAIERRRSVAYIPWFWRPIMSVVRGMPEFIFKRFRF